MASGAVVGAGGERGVDAAEEAGGGPGIGADDDAVGVEEVGDGGALAQELGVGDDVEEAAGDAVALDGAADPLVGVDRDGGFFDDDLVAGEGAGNLAGDRFDVGEVCIAGLGLGGADGDEDGIALAGGLGEVGGETDAGVAVTLEELREVVLVDEGVAGLEGCDLVFVVIDADDGVTDLGEADGGDQADITRANNGDLNGFAHVLRQMVLLQCNADSLVDFRSKRKSNQDRRRSGPKPGQAEESRRYDLLP